MSNPGTFKKRVNTFNIFGQDQHVVLNTSMSKEDTDKSVKLKKQVY